MYMKTKKCNLSYCRACEYKRLARRRMLAEFYNWLGWIACGVGLAILLVIAILN